MATDNFIIFLEKNNIKYQKNPSLKDFTTFKVGGDATLIVTPKNINEISKIVVELKDNGLEYMAIGHGSNLLFTDSGYKGVLIKPADDSNSIVFSNDIVTAGAGVDLMTLCNHVLDEGLTGLEFAYGIPGSVGGAVYMNAGAYNGEIVDVALSCRYVDEDGRIKTATKQDLDLSYRYSMFTDNKKIISDVSFSLKKGDKLAIKEKMDELYGRRVKKQPLEYPSGGSTFKRPVGNYASALIDQCELKGKSVGGAMVSTKHAGFIINFDNATSNDVFDLIKLVQDTVRDKTGYELECEVKIIL